MYQDFILIGIIPEKLPLQVFPFPSNPSLQLQLYEPSLLEQLALTSHGLAFETHSSISNGVNWKTISLFLLVKRLTALTLPKNGCHNYKAFV